MFCTKSLLCRQLLQKLNHLSLNRTNRHGILLLEVLELGSPFRNLPQDQDDPEQAQETQHRYEISTPSIREVHRQNNHDRVCGFPEVRHDWIHERNAVSKEFEHELRGEDVHDDKIDFITHSFYKSEVLAEGRGT